MTHKTIRSIYGIGVNVLHSIETEVYDTIGLHAVREHYYDETKRYSLSPLPIWWFGLLLIASIPVSIYSSITGMNYLPASNPVGAFMTVVTLGSLFALTIAHIGLFIHGKYVNSVYTIRSPIVVDE